MTTAASEASPSISLVIPTFNRAGLLKKALDSVAIAAAPVATQVEVIVVDNNGTDNTGEVVKERIAGFPSELRYVVETHQGSSPARNRGLKEARGTYIVFMDDDQMMDANYLRKIPDAFNETGAACVGGPVAYYNAENIPGWLTDLTKTIGQISYGDQVTLLGADTHKGLGGGNMAFIRTELADAGGFDVRLGRFGNGLLTGEDYEIQDRLRGLNKTVAYHPDLIQYHYLRPERLKKNYWRKYYYAYGRTVSIRRPTESYRNGKFIFHTPAWLLKSFATSDLPSYLASFITFDFISIFRRELKIWTRIGEIYEARNQVLQFKRNARRQ